MERKRNLLLIDNDEIYLNALSQRLHNYGFNTIILTKDIENSLDVIVKNKIELVLLDLIMPIANGKDILKKIRLTHERAELPVIIITGLDGSDDVSESFKLGANDYITKPIKFDVTIARINAHLSQCDLDRELILKKQLEILNAMIITYCHEINNPLSIALAEVSHFKKLSSDSSSTSLTKTLGALNRIQEITKKIRKMEQNPDILFEVYTDSSKMIKIK